MSGRELVAAPLLVIGCLLAVVAVVGLLRFPDLYARMHAATKPATLGLALVALGAAVAAPDGGAVAVLLLVIGLQLLTAPVGAHMLGRAAHGDPGTMGPETVTDALEDEPPTGS